MALATIPQTFNGCYSTSTGKLAGNTGSITQTFADSSLCFSTCASYNYIILAPVGGLYSCTCSSGVTGAIAGNQAKCDSSNSALLYAVIQASPTGGTSNGNSRRRKRGRVLEGDERFCPKGLSACTLPTSVDAYEVSLDLLHLQCHSSNLNVSQSKKTTTTNIK